MMSIGEWLRGQRAAQTAFVAELVRIPSDNPPGDCARHAERTAELLAAMGFSVERHIVPPELVRAHGLTSITNLVARHRFGDGPTIALNAHGDVVPPGEGWTADPYGAEIRDGEELPPQEHADKRVEKLKQEREQLGGVNLRAEEEAAEQEARLTAIIADRADLEGAIERLRRGIQSLNREGRERLLESFEKVNANFQTLFTKLFEGGEAKLTFTESEDPLEAGLEIYARPPGKRLQALSLLSGGEQALTAMSLIFAVFLVNPAPVCVLDEVDAPLDDANVERFCNLLDEMTRLTDTRFLVITHHALTMSRMNRLFGVTMAERGVSQLVSVTLAQAEQVIAAE